MHKHMMRGILAGGCMVSCSVLAQDGNFPWQEYSRLVEQGREIAKLDVNSLFGDKVDLYSGTLSFSATDVSITGNNAMPVAITRKLTIYDRRGYGGAVRGPFADWGIDIPNVNGVFSTTWHDNRCSVAVPPSLFAGRVNPDEYWAGNHADLAGGGEMLQADSTRPKPATGGTYTWITEGDTYFSCLPSIKNGTGQGFLAVDKEGNKYWLDHMAQYAEPMYRSTNRGLSPATMGFVRRKNVLYASRVEDRFGNWVAYSYDNAYDQPVRLTGIASNDGRHLTLQYNTSGYVASVSDGVRTWHYQYMGNALTAVVLPDGSRWSLSLSALTNAVLMKSNDPNDMRTCFTPDEAFSGDVSGSMTHPSGATATFIAGPESVGRSNVPGLCRNYQLPSTPGNDTRDDYPVFPIQWVSLIAKSKQVQGPGLATMQWTYDFGSAWSWQYPPGTTEPVCRSVTCADPVCLSDSCAGQRTMIVSGPGDMWDRYTFGNSYRYNEGKLLKHESGSGSSTILRSTTHTYNYATNGQPYAAKIGSSPQPRGAGFVSEYLRPLVKTDTVQDAALFTWEVDTGCASPGIRCLDAFARPIRVVRTGNTAGGGTSGPTVPPASAPALTAPVSSNTGSYALNWTTVSLATRYELQAQLGSGSWNAIQIGPELAASVDSNPNGAWNYRVRACNVNGCSGWSPTKTVVVTLPPALPVLTTPATNTTGAYTVSWTTIPESTRYALEQRKDGGAWSTIHDGVGTSSVLDWQMSGTYDYRVRACNVSSCGTHSAVSSTVVTLASLAEPTLTAPSSIAQDRPFIVSWTAVSGVTSYVLARSFAGGGYSEVYLGTSTSVSQMLSMTGGHAYRVKACNASGCGPGSPLRYVNVTVGP